MMGMTLAHHGLGSQTKKQEEKIINEPAAIYWLNEILFDSKWPLKWPQVTS